jgi:hypothetical protein
MAKADVQIILNHALRGEGVNRFSHFARRFRLRSPLFEELMYYSELFSDYHKDMEINAAIYLSREMNGISTFLLKVAGQFGLFS